MKKDEIETYREMGRERMPSINVKCRRFAPNLTKERLNCDGDVFDQAMTYAFEAAQERFWEETQDLAEHHFSHLRRAGEIKVYSAGRNSGHLIVGGLPPVDEWNAIEVSAWGRFCRSIQDCIEYHCNSEMIIEDVLENRWNEKGARFGNLIYTESGVVTYPEMVAKAIAAGFGPVVRR